MNISVLLQCPSTCKCMPIHKEIKTLCRHNDKPDTLHVYFYKTCFFPSSVSNSDYLFLIYITTTAFPHQHIVPKHKALYIEHETQCVIG